MATVQNPQTSALTDIVQAMKASRTSDQASGTRPSPADMKSKIDDLIAGEVSSGKLTSDQATELKGVFESAFSKGGSGGPGGPAGAGGPPPPGDSDSSSSSDDSSSSTSATSATDLLRQFIKAL